MNGILFSEFDAIIYINLDFRVDRKTHLLEELYRANVNMDRVHRIDAVFDPLVGERGCLKSHIKALEFAKERNFKRPLILEDDCYFKQEIDRVDKMIAHFFRQVKHWDVFMLGGNIIKHESTEWEGVHQVRVATAAHAYLVHGEYLDEVLFLYRQTLKQMGDFLFPHNPIPHDWTWTVLMEKDRWYCCDIVLHQRADYSNIDHQFRDKTHPEVLNG